MRCEVYTHHCHESISIRNLNSKSQFGIANGHPIASLWNVPHQHLVSQWSLNEPGVHIAGTDKPRPLRRWRVSNARCLLGDDAPPGSFAAGVFAENQAAVSHQLPGFSEARVLSQFGHDRHRRDLSDSSQCSKFFQVRKENNDCDRARSVRCGTRHAIRARGSLVGLLPCAIGGTDAWPRLARFDEGESGSDQ